MAPSYNEHHPHLPRLVRKYFLPFTNQATRPIYLPLFPEFGYSQCTPCLLQPMFQSLPYVTFGTKYLVYFVAC